MVEGAQNLMPPNSEPVALFNKSCPHNFFYKIITTLFLENHRLRVQRPACPWHTVCDVRAVEQGDIFSHVHFLRKTLKDNTNIYPGHLTKMMDELDEFVKEWMTKRRVDFIFQ